MFTFPKFSRLSVEILNELCQADHVLLSQGVSDKLLQYLIRRTDKICVEKLKDPCRQADILEIESNSLFEPQREKKGLWGFRPDPTQTELYKHRR